jgi:8-oxo-dGTP pyrophosphatase MutT (NUDIX family)
MTYRVHFDRKVVVLSDNPDEAGTYPFYHFSYANVPKLLFRLENDEFDGLFFYHFDPRRAWRHFLKFFDVIYSAGGVIYNDEGKVLFLYRRGHWDLPKGKREEGESARETALREVTEETGIRPPEIIRPLSETYHVFWEGGRRKMKITQWFLMHSDVRHPLTPTGAEGIERLDWLDPSDPRLEKGLFNNVKELLRNVRLPMGGI